VLREWIADGTLTPGSELPAERLLAERLDVPRTTVNRAVTELMEEGLVRHNGGYSRLIAGKARVGLAADTVLILAPPIERSDLPPLGGSDQATLGALQHARTYGWHGLVVDTRSVSLENIGNLVDRPWRGLIVGPILLGSRIALEPMLSVLDRFRGAGVPVVGLDDELHPYGYDVVVPDHEAGAYELTKRLLAEGCRRPAQQVAASDERPWTLARRQGYRRAMAEAGIAEPAPVIAPNLAPIDGEGAAAFEAQARQQIGFLIDRFGPTASERPDALLALNDGFALILAHALRLLGCDPERDLRLVGYDALTEALPDAPYETFRPYLTVDRDVYGCGVELVRLLRERLRDGPEAPAKRILVPPRIISHG
jgi:DNA-binding LacI/PurR family transcriptional regulator